MRSRWAPLLLVLVVGCDGRVEQPGYLWLLWLLPLVALFLVWSFRNGGTKLREFVSSELLPRLAPVERRRRALVKSALLLGALASLVLAVSGVQYGFRWEDVKRRGVDVIIALDVSDSMLVEDVESERGLSRLARAQREIRDLLNLLEGDRVGIVAFAGTAFVECPLTLDYQAAALFLGSLDTDLIPVKGTDLGAAIRTAITAFDESASVSRALILITDGEDHGGEALAATAEAATANVRIFTIGIGGSGGAPIPGGGGFRRSESGEIIISRLDEPLLQQMALATGGRYVRSVSGDMDLEQIYFQGVKATLLDQELQGTRRQRWTQRFQLFLMLAFFLLLIESWVGSGRRIAGAE